jgi:hypothetical protein
MDTSKRALMEFIDSAVNKGRLNKNTGAGIRAACKKILEQVNPDEDVQKIDVAAQIVQYNNRHPNELSGESLRVYESRVKTAIETFVQSQTDPTGYKMPGKSSGGRNGKAATRRPAARDEKAGGSLEEESPVLHQPAPPLARAAATETSLALPFPLRPTFLAQVVVPRDLTKEEAKRLAAFLDAIAQEPHA